MDSFGQETREPFVFEKLPVEHKLVGNVLVTSFCDAVQFISLENPQQPGQASCQMPSILSRAQGSLLNLFGPRKGAFFLQVCPTKGAFFPTPGC